MRVAIVAPVFPPEPLVSSRTSADVATALVAAGHGVRVITAFPSRPAGRVYPGYSRRLFHGEVLPSGIRLLRCFSFCSRRSTLASRLLENISYGVTASLALLFGPKPDVVYSLAWPLFAAMMISTAARLRKVPLVTSVQDIYPESLVSQGRIASEGRIAHFLRVWDTRIARHNVGTIVISESFRRIYVHDRRLAADKVHMIPNWTDRAVVTIDSQSGHDFRMRIGIPAGARLAVYGGNVGAAAGVAGVVRAFHQVADRRWCLLIAGEGSALEACEQEAANGPARERIFFHHPWPAAETSPVLNAADLLLLPTHGAQSLASVPSKLLAYMLAGKPVLVTAIAGSDVASTIARARCGWVVEPDSEEQLASAFARIGAEPEQWTNLGDAGRKYVLENQIAERLVPRVLAILSQAALCTAASGLVASEPSAQAEPARRA